MDFRAMRITVLGMFLAGYVLGCSSDDSDDPPPPPVPVIENINSSVDPKSPEDVAIEINGYNFLDSPGTVRFSHGTITQDEFPAPAGWNDGSIVVVVPTTFTVPVTVTVSVITEYGESNTIDLDIVEVPPFNPSSLAWATTTALPEGLRGLKGSTVPFDSTRAYVYVTGGQTGGGTPANRDQCRSMGVTVSGSAFTPDGSWTDETSLPQTRAFHAMASAHAENSRAAPHQAYLYAVGGQAQASDTPGGTTDVFVAATYPPTGAVGSWNATASLPAPRWGHAAFVYRNVL
ncbi:MAG: Kelch repeat-containing protein, partial [Planctomycetota bacterium]